MMITRFAPSPTGFLHLGNIRTALFNALLAYQQKGQFWLRIEDTDTTRSSIEFIQEIQKDLQWLGLEPVPRNNLTLLQSERSDIYDQFYKKLEVAGAIYPCFCNEDRLNRLRATQQASHQPPGYDGHCRHLSPEAVNALKKSGALYHLRFKVPDNRTITFHDMVKGTQSFKSTHLHDFVVRRSNGQTVFLYCNVLDDALMGITHVLRGEDHLTNTAKQLLLLESLGLSSPQYGHLSLISRQEDTKPLSKRDNSFGLRLLKAQGYFPEAILNYLARLGHTIAEDSLLPLGELAKCFSLEKLHKSSAHFDKKQLDYWQKQAMNQQNSEVFWKILPLSTQAKVPVLKKQLFIQTIQSMITLPAEAIVWADYLFSESLHYEVEIGGAIQRVNPLFWSNLLGLLEENSMIENTEVLFTKIKKYVAEMAGKTERKLYWQALRGALTNCFSGPDMYSLFQLLGVEGVTSRLKQAMYWTKEHNSAC